jgi:hypothetical protein
MAGVEFQGKLLAAQHRKKQADNDRQLLLNRIALLKKEESRAWRKIEKTKERADEIVRIREENATQRAARERLVAQGLAKQAAEAAANSELEARARLARQSQIDALIVRKRGDVAKVREQAAVARDEILAARRSDVVAKQERRAEIKTHEERVRADREANREHLREANRDHYDGKVHAEERETRAREGEVAKMERIEMALIQQLKNTQVIQQQAFSELESALNGEADDGQR